MRELERDARGYYVLTDEMTEPLIRTGIEPEDLDRMTVRIMQLQDALSRHPLLRNLNIVDLMQRVTPAGVQKKIAAKKSVRTAQYLGEHNRACIAYWRRHGITDLRFLDPGDADSLRQLPIMKSDYFYNYAPEDRFSGDVGMATPLMSSGSTGTPKHFFTSPQQIVQTLPLMKQFLRSNWEIDRYDRVAVVITAARSEPGQPRWGAGYHMVELLKIISEEGEALEYRHTGMDFDATVAYVEELLEAGSGRTLIAIYSYAPDVVSIVQRLTDFGRDFNRRENVDFKITSTGEPLPPYKLFQLAEWLKITEPGLVECTLDEVLDDPERRKAFKDLVKSFSVGFGAAELQSGLSGNDATALWNAVVYLLSRNEPERVAPFLDRYFQGRNFPWSAFKASPNLFFTLGTENGAGEPTLEKPEEGVHSGPVFVTSLPGEVVNAQLDFMHIWDMHELAARLKDETGVNVVRVARQLGLRYDAGDMLLTNGRMDSTGYGGLDAAVSWRGLKIYGHILQRMIAEIPELSGRFTAQNVDYEDGTRTAWLHFEARPDTDVARVQHRVRTEGVAVLESINKGFALRKSQAVTEGGPAQFEREMQLRVLPFGHARFERPQGRSKYRYVRSPVQIRATYDPDVDPFMKGLI